jgi:hypothetical protein
MCYFSLTEATMLYVHSGFSIRRQMAISLDHEDVVLGKTLFLTCSLQMINRRCWYRLDKIVL